MQAPDPFESRLPARMRIVLATRCAQLRPKRHRFFTTHAGQPHRASRRVIFGVLEERRLPFHEPGTGPVQPEAALANQSLALGPRRPSETLGRQAGPLLAPLASPCPVRQSPVGVGRRGGAGAASGGR